MDVTFTLGFFAANPFAAISFVAVSFAESAIDERSPGSMHFHFLLLIVGVGGNSREVRPARRPAHVRRALPPKFPAGRAGIVRSRNGLRASWCDPSVFDIIPIAAAIPARRSLRHAAGSRSWRCHC